MKKEKVSQSSKTKDRFKKEAHAWKKSFTKYYQLYFLLIPVIANYVIFHYVPMYGIQLGFKEWNANFGVQESAWVGLKHFERFITLMRFKEIFINTLWLSFLSLAFSFPLSICLALVLNEIQNKKLNSTLQTVFFVPHFVSTVVIVGMMNAFLSPSTGIVNILLTKMNIIDEGIYFMRDSGWFRPLYIISGIWQNMGWSAAIYISALSAIDTELYDAAAVDGANKWQQLIRITIPSIMPTIIIQLILKLGHVMSVGYEKTYLMQNNGNSDVAEVISTYVYKTGIKDSNYDYATAVGLFNSIINLAMLLLVNWIAKKKSDVSLF